MKPDFPTWLPVESPNKYVGRKNETVRGVVIHYTAAGSGKGTADYFAKKEVSWKENGQLKTAKVSASAHLVIDRDGTIYQCVPFADRAWHAGPATLWKGQPLKPGQNVNDFTIGIEIANWGLLEEKDGKFFSYTGARVPMVYRHRFGNGTVASYWELYTEAQFLATVNAMKVITHMFPNIRREDVLGHEQIQLNKKDPGQAWQWDRFLDDVFGENDDMRMCLDEADDDDRSGTE